MTAEHSDATEDGVEHSDRERQSRSAEGAPTVEQHPHLNDETHPFFVIGLPERLAEVRAIGEEVIRWVERADLKATILMGGAGAVFSGELLILDKTVKAANKSGAWLGPQLLVISMVLLLCAGFLAALAVYPRLGNPYEGPVGFLGRGDLLYFGSLRKLSPDDFVLGITDSLTHQSLIDHYAAQIQVNSQVVWRKHKHIRVSLVFFGFAGVLAVAGVIAYVTHARV